MDSKSQEKFQIEYRAGKNAFERGQYRLSVKHLETASQLIASSSRLGGETRIWLVTAYQAAGRLPEAIALGKQLCSHPNLEIRKQSKRLVYIIEAPKLNRPKEWMSEIPDLSTISDRDPQDLKGITIIKSNSKPTQNSVAPPVDLSQVNAKDNQFIWVALLAIVAILGGLIWFGS